MALRTSPWRALGRPAGWLSLLLLPTSAMAIDLAPLWDFSRPDESERRLLHAMEPALTGAGPEVQARHALELGRIWVSATRTPAQRTPEALALQLDLARAADAAGRPDPHVFDELEALHRARGENDLADRWAARRRAAGSR